MATLIAVVGNTGTGKSTSLFPYKDKNVEIKGLNPNETVLINVSGKPLPTPNAEASYPLGKLLSQGGRHFKTNDPFSIKALIEAIDSDDKFKHIKNIVVDDAVYIQLLMFMDRILEKGYDKYSEIGQAAYLPIKAAQSCTREDLTIIFMYHFDKDNDGFKRVKTAGKLTDQYLNIEGMFTFVFYSNAKLDKVAKKVNYWFDTQNDGYNTAKSPLGCFENYEIPNDMGLVIETIKNYYKK